MRGEIDVLWFLLQFLFLQTAVITVSKVPLKTYQLFATLFKGKRGKLRVELIAECWRGDNFAEWNLTEENLLRLYANCLIICVVAWNSLLRLK